MRKLSIMAKSRTLILPAFLLGFALVSLISVLWLSSPSRADDKIVTETVLYSKTFNAEGFLARPKVEGKYPAIILIHEWWGLNDNISDFAKRFAELGYVALAVDLYNGKSTKTADEARALATSVRENMELAFANLNDAISFLKGKDYVDSTRLASIGWCFGGQWSYFMAKNNLGTKASVIYYGRFNPEDDLSQMRAKIIGHFGEDDAGIRVDTVKEFQAKLKTLSGDHEIYIYPNAGHAFANEGGSRYHKESAELAWKRTIAFLKKYL